MNCDWTEKISLLIDGELAGGEARAVESHLADCAACSRAKDDFLLLREQISSYPLASDSYAERRALERILAAGALKTPAQSAREQRTTPRGLFTLPRMNPALVSALAVVVLAVALGIFWSLNNRDASTKFVSEKTPPVETREGGEEKAEKAPAASTENKPVESASSNETIAPVVGPESPEIVNDRRRSADGVRRRPPQAASHDESTRGETAALPRNTRRESSEDALAEFAPLFEAAGGDRVGEIVKFKPEPTLGAKRETARHFEQAQILLRSFRNARVEGSQTVADERQRSQKLLYRNIVLRREAARRGNAPVERTLDSLEPILIDIANLPDSPAQEEVRAIRERMQRKDIVAVLQANLSAAERGY